ncbi:MAG TPA: hypothetical protein VFP05_03615 [Thermomicrobiales bacterium]|nr:hypothetical protein [Thermomicrobiales bacterium]
MSDRPRRTRQTNRKPNRAQRKAQEVRLAESSSPAPVDLTVALEQDEIVPAATTAPAQASRRVNRGKSQAATYVLPRDVEYAYIRSDLRRLILTAAALLVLMFVLLFVLD